MKPEKLRWEFWSDDLAVGHVAIDDDHKRILQFIARLRNAFQMGEDEQVVADGIKVIADYSDSHFVREERMLEAAGYAHLQQHRARHESFRDYVAYANSAQHPIDQGELLSYLVDWWVGHIAAEDKMYRSALVGKDALIAAAFAEP
ncbi:bacteriohemerythrin [Paramagnetospirillum kuznetsovii]|nr:hemerythrin family protein [Paramagnetospirillum kuznetsovii]